MQLYHEFLQSVASEFILTDFAKTWRARRLGERVLGERVDNPRHSRYNVLDDGDGASASVYYFAPVSLRFVVAETGDLFYVSRRH